MGKCAVQAKTLRDRLIRDAKQFCAKEGIKPSHFARIVINHGGFFKRLAKGADCHTSAYERFQEVFNNPKTWEAAKQADRERRKGCNKRGAPSPGLDESSMPERAGSVSYTHLTLPTKRIV